MDCPSGEFHPGQSAVSRYLQEMLVDRRADAGRGGVHNQNIRFQADSGTGIFPARRTPDSHTTARCHPCDKNCLDTMQVDLHMIKRTRFVRYPKPLFKEVL